MSSGAKFAVQTVGLSVVMAVVGYLPTQRLAGTGSAASMAVGIGVSLVGSWIGAASIALMGGKATGANVTTIALTSGLLRFVVVVASALAVALSGLVDRAAFLVWLAIAYVVLLPADTLYALRKGVLKPSAKG